MTSCSTYLPPSFLQLLLGATYPSIGHWKTLEWSSCMSHPHPSASIWLQQPTWWAEFPWPCCFLLAIQPPESCTSTASTRVQASWWEVPTQLQRMAGMAAMFMELTSGFKFGNLGDSGRSKPRLGVLTVKETAERKDSPHGERIKHASETRMCVETQDGYMGSRLHLAWFKVKCGCEQCECVLVCHQWVGVFLIYIIHLIISLIRCIQNKLCSYLIC